MHLPLCRAVWTFDLFIPILSLLWQDSRCHFLLFQISLARCRAKMAVLALLVFDRSMNILHCHIFVGKLFVQSRQFLPTNFFPVVGAPPQCPFLWVSAQANNKARKKSNPDINIFFRRWKRGILISLFSFPTPYALCVSNLSGKSSHSEAALSLSA